jgi:hypothetical protein
VPTPTHQKDIAIGEITNPCNKSKMHLLQEMKDAFSAGNERPICCRKSKTHLLQEIKDTFAA